MRRERNIEHEREYPKAEGEERGIKTKYWRYSYSGQLQFMYVDPFRHLRGYRLTGAQPIRETDC